ncbi:major facilitator superfamily transporter [Colletotrichum tofieldiae]|nr:major facilitator superfamily transporter [Colletotrichum tofieldiae]
MGQDELNEKGLEGEQQRPFAPVASPEPSIRPASSISGPEVTNDKDQHEATSDDGPNPASGQLDPENLTRQPSGPAYSVFPPSTKRWVAFMASVACFVPPMSANIYYPFWPPSPTTWASPSLSLI